MAAGSSLSRQEGVAFPQIWTMDFDGGNPRQLTVGMGSKDHPAWSPDGTRNAFEWDAGIYTMDATGGDLREITPPNTENDDDSPAWSPDGTLIAFRRSVDGVRYIFTMTPSGGQIT